MIDLAGLPRTYWILWTGALINRLGGFVMPLLALYLTGERGLSVEQAGLVVSLYGAGALLSGPVGGALADRWGRRSTLVLALVGWPSVARGVRGILAVERTAEYAEAARASGAGPWQLMVRHLLPAARGLLGAQATILVPAFVMA
jgi:ABC-type dipeptide/oligopeptide/nickel transport system permease subunit